MEKKLNKGLVALIIFTLIMVGISIADSVKQNAHAQPIETTVTTATTTTSVETETNTTSTTTISTTSTTETSSTTTTVELETSTTPSQGDEIIYMEEPNEQQNVSVEQRTIVEEKKETTISTTLVETVVTTEATTTETIVEETEEVTEEETESSEEEEVYLGNFRITGYVAGAGAKTASGTTPSSTRTIAMNKTQFKNMGLTWGDKIRIEGIGTFVLEDCGCKSGVIDVFRNSVSACYDLPPYADAYLIK